jgi:RHS repeat-associated protein
VLGLSGKRQSVTDQSGNITRYQYDGDGRLTQEAATLAGVTTTTAYNYDNVGNRLSKTVNGTTTQTFTYDADDRVLNTGYSYDANGNVKSDGNHTYTWDWENVLTETDASTGNQAIYVSDANGLRIQLTTAGVTINYTVDEDSGYGNVVEERSSAGALTARYDYGDDLLRMDRGSAISYYLFDGLGSSRQLTDQNGNVTDTDSYDAYGNLIAHSGTTVNPYLFDGQEQDGTTGLYYLRARYMDPSRGEFLGQDPFEGLFDEPISLHRYLYASDDPTDMFDPGGQDDIEEVSVSSSISTTLAAISPVVALNALTFVAGVFDPAAAQSIDASFPPGSVGGELGTGVNLLLRPSAQKILGYLETVGSRNWRNIPGLAQGGEDLPVITGRWLRGSDGNAGRIPGQIAAQLKGMAFPSFAAFRVAFWKLVAADPVLSKQFSPTSIAAMRLGGAPVVVPGQNLGQRIVYEIHHIQPISQGGLTYDMDNLIVATPRYHKMLTYDN